MSDRPEGSQAPGRPRRGARQPILGAVGLSMVVALWACGPGPSPSTSASQPAVAVASPGLPSPSPAPSSSPSASPSPSPSPSPTPVPSPSPSPSPSLVPAPLTGRLVAPNLARRRVIAVMVDDLRPARPQAGFTAASVVWQAPAEGGIPRYMMVFQEGDPPSVGPVRSARDYFVAWAAEWQAIYVHSGGSPGALSLLRAEGRGQLVWNADEFRWGGRYLWRVKTRSAPHNVYTDGKHLRSLQKALKAPDPEAPSAAAWRFGPAGPLQQRPVGGRIQVVYPANTITYAYDRSTNTYLRSVTGEKAQVDAGTDVRVAPTNVVVMLMSFAPLRDGTTKKRLEAAYIGSGTAWIATNGQTIKGTWRKKAIDAPTLFFDAAGKPVTLTVGQTFIQVLPKGSKVSIKDGATPTIPRDRSQSRPS
jgi:hypothetical protein